MDAGLTIVIMLIVFGLGIGTGIAIRQTQERLEAERRQERSVAQMQQAVFSPEPPNISWPRHTGDTGKRYASPTSEEKNQMIAAAHARGQGIMFPDGTAYLPHGAQR